VLTELRLSNSGNVEDVTALALGFVAFAASMQTNKYFPNLGSILATCADAFGWHEICSPYSCRPPFSAPPLLHWRLCAFPACENRPMRLLVLVIVTSLGTGPSLAQTNVGGSSASGATPGLPDGNPTSLSYPLPSAAPPPTEEPQRPSPNPAQNLHDRAVAACKEMWDAGTHMTKQQWSNTCKRIQTRLDNLGVEATMPKVKAQIR
jgi:hypothetical protein